MVSDTRASVPVRLLMLLGGLFIFAISMALTLQCNLGASSWAVLHDGIARQTPLSIGIVTQLVGLAMLVVSWVGGIRPGFGTLANMLLIGSFLDIILWSGLIPEAQSYPARFAMLLAAVVVIGLGSALYIKAGFGAGPRDSFMLVVHRRTGLRLGIARWLIEVVAVAIGIILGGDFGIGTIIFAMLVGFSIDWFFTHLGVRVATPPARAAVAPADV